MAVQIEKTEKCFAKRMREKGVLLCIKIKKKKIINPLQRVDMTPLIASN